MRNRFIRFEAAVLAAALATAPLTTHAQGAGDKAAAEALFDQARDLIKKKQYPEACKKLEESQRLDPGTGTLLYLADCYEKTGRTASAWATFREAAAMAVKSNDNKREKIARARADKLEAKLSKLTVNVSEANAIAGFELTLDGDPIARPVWGTALPVDPGEHRVEAKAPGKKPWGATVKVGADKDTVSVTVPDLEDAPVEEPEPGPVPPPETDPKPVKPGPAATPEDGGGDDGSGQRTLGLVVGGVGVVGLGVSLFFGSQAVSKDSDAEKECTDTGCTPKGVDLGDDADSAATLSTITFLIGTAALAGGIILYATAPSEKATGIRSVRVTPVATNDSGGVWLGGTF